jgi:hypothetical protein
MIVLLVGAALIGLALVSPLAVRAYRRRRLTAELRGDWWAPFERDLREYMSQTWRSAREAERHV